MSKWIFRLLIWLIVLWGMVFTLFGRPAESRPHAAPAINSIEGVRSAAGVRE